VFLWSDSQSTGFSALTQDTFIIKSTNGVGINTNSIATYVDIEINQVMRLKPLFQTGAFPFGCNSTHEGSIFMYKNSTPQSYLCYCGYG
jgi:hypothetical protein